MLDSLLVRLRPEILAGGFTRDDGTVEFYLRIRALLRQEDVVLDLGAGRGAQILNQRSEYIRNLLTLRGNISKIIGADVDPIVKTNRAVDEAVVIDANGILPFGDETFDLILSDWVLEHVEDPNTFLSEVYRVLKPGGWFCARTPNKLSYFAIGSRVLPSWLESRLLHRLQDDRNAVDVFPKRYLLNTMRSLRRYMKTEEWDLVIYHDNPPPAYSGRNVFLFYIMEYYQRIFPSVILLYSQKK